MVFDLAVLLWDTLNPRGHLAIKAPRRSFFSWLPPAYRKATRPRDRKILSFSCPEVEIYWGRPCFAKIRIDGRTVHLIDTFSYFTMGLGKALQMIGAPVAKLAKPKDLGKRIIPLAEVRPYLTNDCRGVLALLKEIQHLHEKYETRLCVSLPQLSSRIFRHFYLKKDFCLPPKPLIVGGLLSYHGGKNSFPGKSARWYKNCWDLDINSAYPEAMGQLPDFENGRWVLGRGLGFLRRHPHGIYKIDGLISSCPWGSLFTHDFKRAAGKVRGLWSTGYEISEALRSGELKLAKIQGYGFSPNIRKARGFKSKEDPAFQRFVADFYALKAAAKTKAEGYFYKLILNSLYGKFIQRTEDENGAWVAGSMFDPAIASLITGYVRAKIHRLEHKYNSIHTATDGFITQKKPDPKDLGAGIGKLKADTFGPVLILRNKLYLHFNEAGELKKSGLHGFEGNPEELEALWKSSKRIYNVKRLVKWGEAWHIGIPPGTEISCRRELKIAGN